DSEPLSGYICTCAFVRFSSPYSHREVYSPEPNSQEKGDSLVDGYVSELWDLTRISVDKHLFRALAQFWNPAYSCFTFGKVDLVPTIEEYVALLRCSKFQGDSKCIPWKSLKDLILTHPDVRKRVDVFALSIYGLVVFPKALGHVDEKATDLFDWLDKRITPIPAILVDRVSYRVFSKNYSPLKEIVATPRKDDISEEKWIVIFQNLQEEDIEWRAPWLLPDEILYRCGNFDWVPLLGIWGVVGYTPLLVLRQYRRINDNTPKSNQENSQSIEEYLRVVPSELEIIRKDFERRNADLEKKIEQMEEEKINLRLDIDVQKLKTK
ncbi:hypothetical protein Gotur_034698, partial [Gossypium turneri]